MLIQSVWFLFRRQFFGFLIPTILIVAGSAQVVSGAGDRVFSIPIDTLKLWSEKVVVPLDVVQLARKKLARCSSVAKDAWSFVRILPPHLRRHCGGMEDLEYVAESDPDSTETAPNLGVLYLSLRRFEYALPVFSSLVQREPASAQHHYHLAVTLQAGGSAATARTEYQTCLAISDPADKIHSQARPALDTLSARAGSAPGKKMPAPS
jgi:tetratricopeptide (TPR) repeat protein